MKKLIWVLVLMAIAVQVKAEVPKLINYSGKLTDKQGNILEDKIYDIRFSLCTTQTGAIEVWAEEHYNAQGRGVQTYGGGFNVVLGGTTPLPAFEQNYWIQIRINIKGTDETFSRQEMLSVPYAMRADDGTPKGAIIMWTGSSCPCGYRRLNELDGLFPRAAASYSGGVAGGADSHSHGGDTQMGGVDHSHNYSGDTEINEQYQTGAAMATTSGIAPIYHTHRYSGTTGGPSQYLHTHGISSDSNIPRYFNVIFCLKE